MSLHAGLWEAFGQVVDNAGWPGAFDDDRQGAYALLLGRWVGDTVIQHGERRPLLLAALVSLIESGERFKFMPSADRIAAECHRLAGTTPAGPELAEATAMGVIAACSTAVHLPHVDPVALVGDQCGAVAAAWLQLVTPERIRRTKLGDDPYAEVNRRQLEDDFREFARRQAERHAAGLPTAAATTAERLAGAKHIGELVQGAGE
ncbi:MAG: hypothetical protein PGN13_16450 [Patulibacter minatonensis]